MGVEIFLIVLIVVLAVGGFFFFSGSFGLGKAQGDDQGGRRPKHAYVENNTAARPVGVDTADEVKARAEDDPDTEVRA
jgi:hypothetical protein